MILSERMSMEKLESMSSGSVFVSAASNGSTFLGEKKDSMKKYFHQLLHFIKTKRGVKMLKVLNNYSGIGGNRRLWENVEVTAVENDPSIAAIYHDFFPQDKIVIGDAHQYLLEHFEEYDFIWSSPPCPTHSQLGRLRYFNNSQTGCINHKVQYPDMKLYEEILLMKYFFNGKWCIENVIAYYTPLIKPVVLQRHHFWSNFHIGQRTLEAGNIDKGKIKELEKKFGFDLSKYSGIDKRKALRNCVESEVGLHILNESKRDVQGDIFR